MAPLTGLTRLAATIAFVLLCATAAAQDAPNNYQEPGFNPGRDYVNQHFNEHIDPFTGNLELQYVDVFIPGNGPLDLKVQRSYNLISAETLDNRDVFSPFGQGWDINFGRVRHAPDQDTCSYDLSRPNSLVLELPDGSEQAFVKSNVPGTNTSNDYITKGMWKAKCDPISGGMIVYAPDGTRYDMTIHDQQDSRWLVSQIVGRTGCSGCTLTFTYRSFPAIPRMVPDTVSGLGNSGALVTFNYAGQGNLSGITAQGRSWQYTVAADPNGTALTRVAPPAGNPWIYTYYPHNASVAQGALQSVTYPTGGLITYAYQNTTFFTNVLGAQVNAVVHTKTAGNDTWTYSYTPSTGIGSYDTTTIDQPGTLPALTYKHFGFDTVAPGNVWEVGLLYQESVGTAQTTQYTWSSMEISTQSITSPGYDKFDADIRRPLLAGRTVTRDGGTFTTTYSAFDAFGNPQSMTETGSRTRTKSLAYFDETNSWILGLLSTDTTSGVGTITRNFDAQGNMLSETRFGVTTSYSYNPEGTVASRTDANGHVTTYSSYVRGVPQTEHRPDGVTITRTVDNWGNVTQLFDGVATWGYAYDGLNRLTSVDYPLGTSASITWAPTSRTLVRGPYVDETDYDEFGRVIARERGNILLQYAYDALGRKIFESLPDSAQGTTFTLDSLGRIASTSSPNGTTTRSYTPYSVAITNERSQRTTYTYDRFGDPDQGFLNQIDSPAGTGVAMSRDLAGNLLSATQGAVTRTYGYDSRLFLVSVNEPETGTTTLGRDNVGNVTSKTVGGHTTSYTYDPMNRLTRTVYPNSESVSFGYDQRGLLTSVANDFATRTYQYDPNGNMIEDGLEVEGRTLATTYSYDAIDGLASMTYPAQMTSSRTVNFNPDALGRPTSVSPFASSVTYHPSGNLAHVSYANGVSVDIGEEPNRLIPNSVSASGSNWSWAATYDYDGVGNLTSFTESTGNSGVLAYDGADRLASASGPWGNGSFAYTDDGNITSWQLGSKTANFAYAQGNRLTSVSANGQPTLFYTYDTYGNVTNNGRNAFQFDDASSLRCVDCGTGNEISYAYDGKGWRVWQQKGGVKTYFQHAANGDLLFEYTPATGQWKQHVYLAGKRIATRSSDLVATTTSLAATNDAYGGLDVLTASVVPSAATGTVLFQGGSFSVTEPLVNGVATMPADTLPPGNYTFTAEYAGDFQYAGSTSPPLAVVVTRRLTTMTIVRSPASPGLSDPITISVSLFGDDPTPTGTVSLTVDSQAPSVLTLANGSAVFNLPPQAAGAHTATIAYSGDATYRDETGDASFSVGPSNIPPSVAITSPADGSHFVLGDTVPLSAAAADSDGPQPSTLAYYDQVSSQIATGAAPSYDASWIPQKPGAHVLTAKVTDSGGATTTSAPVTIQVDCPAGNQPPSVSVTSPTSGSTFSGPLTIPITVSASDPENALTKVEFYLGSTKLGEATTPPYSFNWGDVGGGTFSLTARAIDECGNATDSSPVTVTVNAQTGFVNGGFESPIVTAASPMDSSSGWIATDPAHTYTYPSSVMNGAQTPQYAAPEGNQAAYFRDTGSIKQSVWLPPGDWQVTFRSYETEQGAPAPILLLMDGVQLYESTPVYGGGWSYDATPVFSTTDPGEHVFEFSGGNPATSQHSIFIDSVAIGPPDQAPSVTLDSPIDGELYLAGSGVLLAATATDSDGTITKVEFLDGSRVIATITTPPYTYVWSTTVSGTHAFSARAIDDRGVASTSATATITTTGLVDGGFETPVFPGGTGGPLPSSSGWTMLGVPGNGGVLTGGYMVSQGYPVPPEGAQCGYYNQRSGLRQTVTLAPGTYSISLRAMANRNYPDVQVKLSVNGTQVGTTGLGGGVWGSYTTPQFTIPTQGDYTFDFTVVDTTQTGWVYIDDIRLTKVGSPPAVNLVSPPSGATYGQGDSIPLIATALDSDGAIQNVQFLDGANVIATVTTPVAGTWPPQYEVAWSTNVPGAHVITAKATDNSSASTTSSAANISVTCSAANAPPSVALTSPVASQQFAVPAMIPLAATASDDGSVALVEYFQGSTKIGESTTPPYSATWTAGTAGGYSITAKATDNCGASTTSSPVSVTVNATPPGFSDGGFETPVFPAGSGGALPSSTGWTLPGVPGNGGVLTGGYMVSQGYPAPPEGAQCAYYNQRSGLRQTLTLPPGNYSVSLSAMANRSYPNVQVKVSVSGVQVGTTGLAGGAWRSYTTPQFTIPTQGDYTFDFAVVDTTQTGWVYIDNIRLNGPL